MYDPRRTLCGGDIDRNGRDCDYPIPFVSFFSFCWLTKERVALTPTHRPQSPLLRPARSPKYTPTTTNTPPLRVLPSSLHRLCYRWYPLQLLSLLLATPARIPRTDRLLRFGAVGHLDGVPVSVPYDGAVDALAALLPANIDPRPVVGVAGDMLARYTS